MIGRPSVQLGAAAGLFVRIASRPSHSGHRRRARRRARTAPIAIARLPSTTTAARAAVSSLEACRTPALRPVHIQRLTTLNSSGRSGPLKPVLRRHAPVATTDSPQRRSLPEFGLRFVEPASSRSRRETGQSTGERPKSASVPEPILAGRRRRSPLVRCRPSAEVSRRSVPAVSEVRERPVS